MRRTLLNLLRLLIAGLLLWFVARSVPWSDQLVHGVGDGEVAFSGQLLDDWKADSVLFRMDLPSKQGQGEAPSALQELARRAAVVRVQVGGLKEEGTSVRVDGPFTWRPGMPRAFADLELSGLATAFGFLLLGSLFAATRWWRLLGVIGCSRSWAHVLRLTYVGLFFNLVFPGLNGGDVARAVLVVRENPGARADALMSVVVDRLIGLVAMIALAGLAVWTLGEVLQPLLLPVSLAVVAALSGLAVLQSRRLRRWLKMDSLLPRLPQGERLARLDQAWMVYASRRLEMTAALALSFGNHLSVTAAVWCLGHAVGDELGYLAYLSVVTVTNTITSLPISPGGWGLGEASFHSFFTAFQAEPALGVAASVTYRLCNVALGLAGGLALLVPGHRLGREELEAALREDPPA